MRADAPDSGGPGATGGGWLAVTDGGKVNFGFHVAAGSSLRGGLQLVDKPAGVTVHIRDVSVFGDVAAGCGTVAAGPETVEIRGGGTFNGAPADFRVCVADNGEPGAGDLFHLQCVSGCDYSTSAGTADDVLDGGNIQVRRDSARAGTASGGEAAVLVLDPVLLTEAPVGVTTMTVRAYDATGGPAAGQSIRLETPNGPSLAATSDAAGRATYTVAVPLGNVEIVARLGGLTSNAVEITGLD